MVYRHSLVTRTTHAVFFLLFLALTVSGLQMLLRAHWIPMKIPVLHFWLGVAMVANGIVYVGSGMLGGDLRKLLFAPADVGGLWPMAAYYAGLRKTEPRYDGYNPLQKLAYTLVLMLIAPLIAASGLALWLHIKAAALWHIGFAVELAGFFGGHLAMVATTGLRKNLRAIVTGWYPHQTRQSAVVLGTAPTTTQSPQASTYHQAQPTPASR